MFYCKRFETLPGIKDGVFAFDDMVCDFWGVPDAPRDTAKQNEWAKAVYERDDYTCQSCGLHRCLPSTTHIEQGGRTLTVFDPGIQLQAHHIKPYALYPKLAWDIDNGITLCDKCHHEAHEHRIDRVKAGIIEQQAVEP
jgi:predicted restriction endonuclease